MLVREEPSVKGGVDFVTKNEQLSDYSQNLLGAVETAHAVVAARPAAGWTQLRPAFFAS
jgi:hypothetical protein